MLAFIKLSVGELYVCVCVWCVCVSYSLCMKQVLREKDDTKIVMLAGIFDGIVFIFAFISIRMSRFAEHTQK